MKSWAYTTYRLFVLLATVLHTSAAFAEAIYEYIGPPFNELLNNGGTLPAGVSRVTATVTLDSLLLPGIQLGSPESFIQGKVISFSISDGATVITENSPGMLLQFKEVATNDQGELIDWLFVAVDNNTPGIQIGETTIGTYTGTFSDNNTVVGDYANYCYELIQDGCYADAARARGNVGQWALLEAQVIDGIEITQATQKLQSLDDLQANGPVVDIVSGKDALVRVYFKDVSTEATYLVERLDALSNVVEGKPNITLRPGCTPELQRKGETEGCESVDFFLARQEITAGNSQLDIRVSMNGAAIDQYTLQFEATETNPIYVVPVNICDSKDVNQEWQCSDAFTSLSNIIPFMQGMMPANNIDLKSPADIDIGFNINVNVNDHFKGGVVSDEYDSWLYEVEIQLKELFGRDEVTGNYNQPPNNYYVLGVMRTELFDFLRNVKGINNPKTGQVFYLGDPGLPSSEFSRVGWYMHAKRAIRHMAHEMFHMLGVHHPDVAAPTDKDQETGIPRCDAWVSDSNLWSNEGYVDATIQEIGYNLDSKSIRLPYPEKLINVNYDISTYCKAPTWVSPLTYNTALNNLRVAPQASQVTQAQTTSTAIGAQWLVSGVISDTLISLKPLFELEESLPSDQYPGSGYAIEVLDAEYNILYSHEFTPWYRVEIEPGGSSENNRIFSELIPIHPGAAYIRVTAPNNLTEEITLTSLAPPTVDILFPDGAEIISGKHELSWHTTDPDSTIHTYRVDYTPDDGNTWHPVTGAINDPSLIINFDDLPGSVGGSRIRIIASDGVITGSAVSNIFTVTKKAPVVTITFPDTITDFLPGELISLQATAYDAEDGFLGNGDIVWISDMDGIIGVGTNLSIKTLSENTHLVTARATDADSNITENSITIYVGMDDDGDGLTSSHEVLIGTNPDIADTDGDGLVDGLGGTIPVSEIMGGIDNNLDGFVDGEQDFGTNPTLNDTDGDQLSDGLEVANGADPHDSNEWPYLSDGDIAPYGNPDGNINAGDVLIAMRIALGNAQASSQQYAHGDMNKDGVINLSDVLIITKYALTAQTATAIGVTYLDPGWIIADFITLNTQTRAIEFDSAGNLYIEDTADDGMGAVEILKLDASSGYRISTRYASYSTSYLGVTGMDFDDSGSLYVSERSSDGDAGIIREIDVTTQTLLGDLMAFGNHRPTGVGADTLGNVYYSGRKNSDGAWGKIYKVDSTATRTILMENTVGKGIALDASGSIFISTPQRTDLPLAANSIYMFDPEDPLNPIRIATFEQGGGELTFDAAGNLYMVANDKVSIVKLSAVP